MPMVRMAMYAKGMTVRDITDAVQDMYGMEVSAQTITNITNKVMPLVEAWQSRPLEAVPTTAMGAAHGVGMAALSGTRPRKRRGFPSALQPSEGRIAAPCPPPKRHSPRLPR